MLAMLAWGLAYVPSAWLIASWPPLSAAGVRLGLAGLLLLAGLAAAGRSLRPGVPLRVVVWIAVMQTSIFYGATFWGIDRLGAGLAAVLSNLDPIFVAVLAVVVLRESLGRWQWVGLGIGLLGSAIVVWDGPLWPPSVSPTALVVAGGALAWAVATVAVARGVRGSASPLSLAGWQMAIGGAILLVFGISVEDGAATVGVREVALVTGLAVLGSALPVVAFYTALRGAPAGEVSAWFFLIPIIGVMTAWPLLGERPSTQLVVGLAAVSVGIWLIITSRGSIAAKLRETLGRSRAIDRGP